MSFWRFQVLREIFENAVASVDPRALVLQTLPSLLHPPAGALEVISVGKAAVAMASGAYQAFASQIQRSLVVTIPGVSLTGSALDRATSVDLIQAGHPLPNEASVRAARRALEVVREGSGSRTILVLLSGGASALMALPAAGISLEQKVALTQQLLRGGAPIHDVNVVRKHVSGIKGGRLFREASGKTDVITLALSDVRGNDLGTIGSGLTVPDPSNFAQARSILQRYGLWGRTAEPIRAYLERGMAGEVDETLKPGEATAARAESAIIGDNALALEGAARRAALMGFTVHRGPELYGEARDLGVRLATELVRLNSGRHCLLAGGEPTVTVRGGGKGGRAQELVLAAALELARTAPELPLALLCAGTDGIDGVTDAAGAFATPDSARRALAVGVDGEAALRRNDSYGFFQALGDLLLCAPTGTNVGDLFVGIADYTGTGARLN